MKKTKEVKAWAVLNKKKQVIAGVGDTYEYKQVGIYFTKPPKNLVYPDEILVPCTITYDLPANPH